jgi:hypothetical protein
MIFMILRFLIDLTAVDIPLFLITTFMELVAVRYHQTNIIYYLQRSAIELEVIGIDNDTKDMLEAINFKDLPGIQVQAVTAQRS